MLQKLAKFTESLAELDLEACHLFLTWFWIFIGGLCQFWTVCRNIKSQFYLPTIWKCLVIMSSAVLLGPTMVYIHGIFLILSFKLRVSGTPVAADSVKGILREASLFAARAKLSEIFFESIPQFLTQILMTSGKGEGGVRELTSFQKISVVSSAATIAFGVSKFGIHDHSVYVSRNHSGTTSYLVLTIFALSEIAFCGGIARFSFALNVGDVHPLPFLVPLVALSSGLAMAPLVSDRFLFPRGEFIFLTFKLCIWISIAGIFFSQWPLQERIKALEKNNSFITFCVTMTVTSLVNFTWGFFHHRHRFEFKVYNWLDSLLEKIAKTMTVQSAYAIDDTNIRHEASLNSAEKPKTFADRYETMKKKQREKKQNMDALREEWEETSRDLPGATTSLMLPPIQFLPRNKFPKFLGSKKIFMQIMLVCCLLLLSVATFSLFFHPLNFKERGYHVEFFHDCHKELDKTAGFPVVSESPDSPKGSICVNNKSPQQMLNIAKVVAKQLRKDSILEPTLLVGNLSYDGNFDKDDIESLKTPFLQPTCTGNERNLIYCEHDGLNVGLSKYCSDETSRLFISIILNPNEFPNVHYFFKIEPNDFSNAERICKEETFSDKNYSSRMICPQESYALIQHLPFMRETKGIWLDHGGYLDITKKKKTIVLRENAGEEVLPSICMVHRKGMKH